MVETRCLGGRMHRKQSVHMWLEAAIGCWILPPRMIGTRNTIEMPLRTRLMNERKSVMERMFSNAFHALAFLRGLPSQTSFMTMIHRTSITIVIIVSPINCSKKETKQSVS